MIPRVFHRVWLDEEMPEVFARFGDRWRATHPHWTLIDWQDSSDLPPLNNQELFDNAKDLVPDDWVRYRSDLARLEIVYQLGGVYLDTDTTPRRALPEDPNLMCWAARSPKRKGGRRPITNAVFGAVAGHPFIDALISRAGMATRENAGKPLAEIVGPWHFTRTYEAEPWPSVHIYPPSFYRQTVNHRWNSKRRRQGKALA